MALDLAARLRGYLFPLILLIVGFMSAIVTIIELVFIDRRPYSDVLNLSNWQDRAFSRTWAIVGPVMEMASTQEIKSVVAQAYGTVLDLGPGKGHTLRYLDPSKITKVYGVEPNTVMHSALRREVEHCKLDDTYTIVSSGIEQLPDSQIPAGSVDSIVCIRVLCSIPKPRQNIKRLYDLLKPGGQLLVFEHHAVPDHKVMTMTGILQGLYNIPWPVLLGGCELNRKTDDWLKQAGEWARIELEESKDYTEYDVVPNIVGRLIKAT